MFRETGKLYLKKKWEKYAIRFLAIFTRLRQAPAGSDTGRKWVDFPTLFHTIVPLDGIKLGTLSPFV